MLLSNASGDDRVVWSGSGEYRTVGKRDIDTGELRRQMGAMLQKVASDRADCFGAFADALDCMQAGDEAGAVAHLLSAGRMGESAWLLEQARAWYVVALEVAGASRERHPEVEVLLALGRVNMRLGRFQDAGRNFHRSLALAEGEYDNAAAADACVGLGNIAREQAANPDGAQDWFRRGLEFARAAGDERRIGELHLDVGESSCRSGEWSIAGESASEARDRFQSLSDAQGLARVLALQAELSAGVGDRRQAAALYREALGLLAAGEGDPALEVSLRTKCARVLIDSENYLEAEEELRRAEQRAIANDLIHELVRIYTLLGSARGRQGDEGGFVFFEQAIGLMRMLDHSQLDEAQLCFEYGVFESRVERPAESRAYLERAREIFEAVGASGGLERVEAELGRVTA